MSKFSGVIFTPDDEPYLGREDVNRLDLMVPAMLGAWQAIEEAVSKRKLSLLEAACVGLFPSTISLALSVRELVRQGYLHGAMVLVRPILERAITAAYLEVAPESQKVWVDGWNYTKRPKSKLMLEVLRRKGYPLSPDLLAEFNSLVHGDPFGTLNLARTNGEAIRFMISKDLSNIKDCDTACGYACIGLGMVSSVSIKAFFENRVE